MTSTTTMRRHTLYPESGFVIPTVAELDALYQKLVDASNSINGLAMALHCASGTMDDSEFAAPPTFENIGALRTFARDVDNQLYSITCDTDVIRESLDGVDDARQTHADRVLLGPRPGDKDYVEPWLREGGDSGK